VGVNDSQALQLGGGIDLARLACRMLACLLLAHHNLRYRIGMRSRQPTPQGNGRILIRVTTERAASERITRERGPSCSAGSKTPAIVPVLLLAWTGQNDTTLGGARQAVSPVRNTARGRGSCSRRCSAALRNAAEPDRWAAHVGQGLFE